MDELDEKVSKDSSLISFFTVTGFCFYLFSFAIKLLDGSSIPLFNKTGSACIGLAVLCFLIRWIAPAAKSRRAGSPILPED